MLFLVTWECDRIVKRNVLFVVVLGAAIIGGVSVIPMMGGVGGATSVAMSDTLCSTLCSGGGTYGTLCRSPGGRIQWWSRLVSVQVVLFSQCDANFCCMRVMTLVCFSGGISCTVVTSSLSLLASVCSIVGKGKGAGSVVETILQSRMCSKLLFQEQRSDCINSVPSTGQCTTHWYLCLPMVPVLLGICK
jgi:hypothetical protein